jgi:hypothetical protein
MKKIMILLVVACIAAASCKKTTYCYTCKVLVNGNDTTICDKSESQLKALKGTVLEGNCAKN